MAARGMTLVVSGARPVQVPPPLLILGGTGTWGWWMPVAVMVALAVLFSLVLRYTQFGRALYAVGGNAEAARLSGIRVWRTRIATFALTGFLAAFSGIILSSRIMSGSSNIAQGLEFEVIAAVIIGGTSLMGGVGTIAGTFLGVLFIGLLGNGMVLMGINPFAQEVIRGLIILAAVLVSVIRKR